MKGRFSIKGKGADLFYDADDDREGNPRPAASEAPEVTAIQPAPDPASPPAEPPPSLQATVPPSAQGTMSAVTQPADIDTSMRHRLRELLVQDHPLHYSYRFTRNEIDALRDIVYELEAKRGLRITRNDVVRLGLNWVIDDYRAHGKDSVLLRVMKEERWKP